MGSIVKSIGKAIKKIGKGIKKVVKKIWPVLLIAAAVYTGVAFYGSTLAGASGATLGTSNFMSGLSAIGTGVKGFFSPAGSTAAAQVAGPTTQALASSGSVFGTGNLASTAGGAFTSSVTTEAAASALAAKAPATFMSAAAGGMTSGDALVYMTKMNMIATGVKTFAGFLDDSEEKQMQHDKELLSMKYAYGKPMTDEQKAYKAENPNWIREHPAIAGTQAPQMRTTSAANTFASRAMSNLPTEMVPPSPYVQQQRIGQPTIGRRSTRQFETPATRAMVSKGPGLITKGTQGKFNPTQQRYS
jgi:hypothetical protein